MKTLNKVLLENQIARELAQAQQNFAWKQANGQYNKMAKTIESLVHPTSIYIHDLTYYSPYISTDGITSILLVSVLILGIVIMIRRTLKARRGNF